MSYRAGGQSVGAACTAVRSAGGYYPGYSSYPSYVVVEEEYYVPAPGYYVPPYGPYGYPGRPWGYW